MRPRRLLLFPFLLTAFAFAQDALEQPWLKEKGWTPLFNGRDLSGWRTRDDKPGAWFVASGAPWAPRSGHVQAMVNGKDGKTADLVTAGKFGDVELYLEWNVPKGSNSGVYLQGLYEVQIFDSAGKTKLETLDAGSIYHRWIGEKPVGGSVAKVNAARPPGEWQSFHIWFRAPRFDRSGKKIENARFLKVVFNGRIVQTDVEVDGPTRAHMNHPEAPLNPLMLQGDHGPVAFRNIYVRPLRHTPGRS